MNEPRNIILKNLLLLAPFDGWSDYALKEAAKKSGLDTLALKKAFPGGVKECLDFFFAEEDRILAEHLPAESLAKMRMPDRIETLILKRLESLLPKREALRGALAIYAMPWNAASSYKALYRTVDLMWKLAGDKSTDFSFYTKRMTLAGLYSSTLLFWLNDESEGHKETGEFIKRRLVNIADFGKFKKELLSKFSQK